jgi:large subunit ribosomal protein L17
MRHRVALKKLNADSQHRVAMRRNLSSSLILHGRVVTTTATAKAFRPFLEKIVTRARRAWSIKDSDRPAYIHALRVLRRDIQDRQILKILVEKVAPLCATRQGGYTRILRDAKNQLGDNAPRAIWEFVDRPAPAAAEGEDAEAGAKAPAKGEKGAKGKAGPEGSKGKAAGAKAKAQRGAGGKGGKSPAKPSDEQGDED